MIVFLDTSVLVKLYIAETGSQALQERVAEKLIRRPAQREFLPKN